MSEIWKHTGAGFCDRKHLYGDRLFFYIKTCTLKWRTNKHTHTPLCSTSEEGNLILFLMAVIKKTLVIVLVAAIVSSISPCYEAGRSCRHHPTYFSLFFLRLMSYCINQRFLFELWCSMCWHWLQSARCNTLRGPYKEWRGPLYNCNMRLEMPSR
jgi:hypothetical protein